MAEQVILSARGRPVAVACDDDEVDAWARSVGADVIRTDGNDLNGSATVALDACRTDGWELMVLTHADLPLVTSFDDVLDQHPTPDRPRGITIVPDRHMSGTNLLVVPCAVDFDFAYGPGSFDLHRSAARAAGLGVTVVEDPTFGWDMDEPDDLAVPPGSHTHSPGIRRLIDAGILTVSDAATSTTRRRSRESTGDHR